MLPACWQCMQLWRCQVLCRTRYCSLSLAPLMLA